MGHGTNNTMSGGVLYMVFLVPILVVRKRKGKEIDTKSIPRIILSTTRPAQKGADQKKSLRWSKTQKRRRIW
jgi:hypothetical protein